MAFLNLRMQPQNELLKVIDQESKRFEERVKSRVRFRGIIKESVSGDPTSTRVSTTNTSIILELLSRDSLRVRDAGFGRYYRKGRRIIPEKLGQRIKRRKKFQLLNRPMFDLYHRLMVAGIDVLQRTTVTNIQEIFK